MEFKEVVTLLLVSGTYLISVAAFIFALRSRIAVIEERMRNFEQILNELKELFWLKFPRVEGDEKNVR